MPSSSAARPAPRCRSRTRTSTTRRHAARAPAGIEGVEAFYGVYDPKERTRWIEIADALGLVCTGGSDWHGPDDALPGVELPDDRAERLAAG